MPIQTDLNVAPYFDDFDASKDFYKVLFRPNVAVQARELNQLQTVLQHQIEKFGDNIFRRGTIVDGCHMSFHSIFPYVKIKDIQTDGTPVNVSQFEGLYIKNSANLQALVVKTIAGFESRNPDLNTLYVRYLNSGTSFNSTAFAADQILTVFDQDNKVFKINVNNGSSGFNNTDNIAVVSSIAIQNTSGGTTFASGFYVQDIINNGVGANAQITAIDTTTNTQVVILSIKPLVSNLKLANAQLWSFSINNGILNSNTGQAANVVSIVGSGATGTPVTDSVGQIVYVAMTATGSGYYVNPTVSVSSLGANLSQLTTANLTPQTFLTQISVGNTAAVPIGTGYGMSVDEGVVYQKGYFARVSKQITVVEKYSNTPDAKAVGFNTNEDIINSSIDSSLLDNAAGSSNAVAPGANRLKLTPVLQVLSKTQADANSDFFSIAEFSDGLPFKQNRQTQYNIIGAEMARRTYEEAGNYVLDQFIMNTKSPSAFADEASKFSVVVDPGQAYISGYRVDTVSNYRIDVSKAIDTQIVTNATISLNYGNYIRINEVGGVFKFSIADTINLYDTAKTYISTAAGAAISSTGTLMGTARIRSMVLESGTPGTYNCIYRLYLFDVIMAAGTNFKNVRSVYYAGTNKGIGDIILTVDPSSNTNVAVLYDNNLSAMTFYSGADAIKNANNVSYTYRTFDETRTANTLGIASKTLGTNETFPYSGTLSNASKSEILYIPLANGQAVANISGGTIASTSGSNVVTGSGTAFLTDLVAGDYINIANTISNIVVRVASIANNTQLILANNSTLTITANAALYFPQNIPVSLDSRRVANVSPAGTVLTIGLGVGLTAGIAVAIAYNVITANVQPVTKSVNRDQYVRLNLSNNATVNTGPWVLGLSDIFRLKNVYLGANDTFVSTDTGITEVTNEFFVDHNQTENFYDTSYLYRKPKSTLALTTSSRLLVKVDAYTTTSDGLKFLQSYPVNDITPLATSTTTVNTLEIPEMFDIKGNYFDLRDQMDLRPISNNTATMTTLPGSATINPVEPSLSTRFSTADKKFPAPNSTLQCNLEYYLNRTDSVVVNSQGNIVVVKGTPGSNIAPDQPQNSLVINNLLIPQYPSLPAVLSSNMVSFSDTKIANELYLNKRLAKYQIGTPVTIDQRTTLQPRGYRMEDIGQLERRIRDLEYYVAFTLAETNVKSRIIPSSVDPTIDRFKFGFFVDSFSDYNYSDINNPEYYATIQDGLLSPKLDEINIEQKFNLFSNTTNQAIAGDVATFPYNEFTLVSQMNATDGSVSTVTTTTPTTTTGTSTTVSPISNNVINVVTTTQVKQTTVNTITTNKNTLVSTSGSVWEETEYKLSSLPGPAAIYLTWPGYQNAIEVFYGAAPGFSTTGLTPAYTALSVVATSSADVTYNANLWGFDLAFRDPLEQHFGVFPKPAVENTGKITWNHDPALGQYVRVRLTKYYRDGQSWYGGQQGLFAYNFVYPSDSSQTTVKTISSPNVFVYNGNIVAVTPATFTIHTTFAGINFASGAFGFNMPAWNFIGDAQAFSIVASGLKPNTIHTFVFDNADQSSKCKQAGKNTGDAMVSGADGTLSFQFFYDAGITEASSDFQQQAKLIAAMSTGIKSFVVSSSDGSSLATGQIEIKTYIQTAINNNITPVANTNTVQTSINVSTILASLKLGNFHL